MRQIWNLTISDYLEIMKLAEADGLRAGDDIEKYLFIYAKKKGLKPSGNTELNNNEILNEMKSHGRSVLEIKIDKEGNQNINIHKKEK